LLAAIGVKSTSQAYRTRVKAHAIRLGLDISHLDEDAHDSIHGDLSMYLIPSQIIAGRVQILLRAYARYIVGSAAGLIAPRPAVA